MTQLSPGRLRRAVRRELSLARGEWGRSSRAGRRSGGSLLLRLVALVALAAGCGGALSAQAPYRQEMLPGFSSVDVGHSSSPALVDLDADGDLDIVAGEYNGILRTFTNTGSSASPIFVGTTGGANAFDGVDIGGYSGPDLVDLDADGDLDALVGASDGTLRTFVNTGSAAVPLFLAATGSANPFDGVDVGTYSSPSLGDLDGDGDLDAVLGSGDGTLSLYTNTGSSTSPAFLGATGSGNPFADLDVGSASSPELADLDGDGDLDALVGENGGHLVFFRSRRNLFADGFEGGDLTAWSNF